MNLQQKYRQAAKEARWALWVTILYVIGWCLCAYLPAEQADQSVFRYGLNWLVSICRYCLSWWHIG